MAEKADEGRRAVTDRRYSSECCQKLIVNRNVAAQQISGGRVAITRPDGQGVQRSGIAIVGHINGEGQLRAPAAATRDPAAGEVGSVSADGQRSDLCVTDC